MSVTGARPLLANEVKRAKRTADPASQARIADARRDLAAAKLEADVLASAMPLTSEMIQRLGVLLRGTS